MNRIVLVGASGHAKVILDVIEKAKSHDVVGLLDQAVPIGTEVFGYPVLGREEDLPRLVQEQGIESLIVAIGDNFVRGKVVQRIRRMLPDLGFATAVHPAASLAKGVTLGQGTAVMAGAVVNSDSRVGDFCIVNTNASLDHDSVMEDFSSLAPNSTTGGNVHLGAYSTVNLGASVVSGIRIGRHTVIAAGATVLDDIEDHVLALGTPAKVVRRREPGEPYL